MRVLTDFTTELSLAAPETYRVLQSAGLTVHRAVKQVVLHGSRGPSGSHRVDSDLDLSLVTDLPEGMGEAEADTFLRGVIFTTLSAWTGIIDLDLAAVYDLRGCGLGCFEQPAFDPGALGDSCPARDCFGIYKVQKGYTGFVRGAGVDPRDMYPCMVIWRRDADGG